MGCSESIMKPIDMTSTPCTRKGVMCLPSLALRLEADEPHHLRLAGPIDIGIQ